ncbi:MAG: hypothetical protein ACRC7N_07265 [Clostridium sp.]
MKKHILIKDFEKYTEMEGQAILIGDDANCKIAKDSLNKLLMQIEGNRDLVNEIIDNLLNSKKPNTKFWGCDLAINCDYNVLKAKEILNEISNTPKIGILALRAEMYLKRSFK